MAVDADGDGRPRSGRLARLLRSKALGSVVAQAVRALGSFVFQLLAARELGASGFGVFAFLFGAMVMAAAASSGLIGDSLTVLDRRDPRVRSALLRLGVLLLAVMTLAGTVTAAVLAAPTVGLAFGAALASFVLADLARRVLMARLMFWTVAVVDVTALAVAFTVLGLLAVLAEPTLTGFLVAMAVGYAGTTVLAAVRLPAEERAGTSGGWGAWREVLDFGVWRAFQQFLRPTMLNVARWLVLVAAGAAAVGDLELARLFVAPALLLVQGLGSYLFASYAHDREASTRDLLARADRAAVVMLAGAVVLGVAAALAWPFLTPLVGDRTFRVGQLAVFGWSVYVASTAAVLPYGSLAAVRAGHQRTVLGIRLLDSVVSLLLAALGLLVLRADVSWVPYLLSVGSFVGGLLCRRLVNRAPQ